MSGSCYRMLWRRESCFWHYLLCIGLSLLLCGMTPLLGLARASIGPGVKAQQGKHVVAPSGLGAGSQRDEPTAVSPIVLPDLQADATQWQTYADGGSNVATVANIGSPSISGHALAVSLLSGTPYTGAHAYRVLPAMNATSFKLQLAFYMTDSINMQGLEFTMDRWQGDQRMEWAVQWEQYSDGTVQQGNPPAWRLWTGQDWQNTGITQAFALSTWHILTLSGDIFNGNVRYRSFSCDDLGSPLSLIFPPVSSPGDKIVIGAQIDGNAHEDPAQVYIDNVNLSVQ